MSSFELGDSICVLIWRKHCGNTLAYPIHDKPGSQDRRIEVVNGDVDTVVKIRIESIESERILGRVVEHFDQDSSEWENAREVLTDKYDLETDIVEQSTGSRLTIRATKDYENQWKEQQQNVFDLLPDRD